MPRFVLFCLLVVMCAGAAFLLVILHEAPPSPSSLLRGARRRTNEGLCSHLAMLLVPSSHAHRRQLIRETWGHALHSRPLGLSVAFGVDEEEVGLEAEVFGDMLLAEGSVLRAAREACGHRKGGAKFLVIVQEEIFVNVFALADTLHELRKRPLPLRLRPAVWCHVREGGTVLTVDGSQWRLSRDVIPTEYSHCDPSAMIVGTGAADALLMLNTTKRRTVDELLTREAGVELVQMEGRYDQREMGHDEGRVLRGQTIFARVEDEAQGVALWNSLLATHQKRET